MYRLFSLSTVLIIFTNAVPKSPKIYNVLISSKKNLSPSHAYPVFEPVLRTTSLGYALPPLLYHTTGPYQTIYPYQQSTIHPGGIRINGISNKNDQTSLQPASTLPLFDPYLPYGYNNGPINSQAYYGGQEQIEKKPPFNSEVNNNQQELLKEKPEDPKTVIANLKRNPEIPDVKPPALPVKLS